MIRDVTASDFDALLRLNLASEHFLSPMNRARLEFLQRQAAYCRVVWRDAEVAAFLLAFREGVDYDSPNYQWFARRYSSFLYIDRVVVDLRHHGKKLGSALYNDLFDFARASGVTSVACEFDVIPPNAASSMFHARFGFQEVGVQWIANGEKKVSLQEASCIAIAT